MPGSVQAPPIASIPMPSRSPLSTPFPLIAGPALTDHGLVDRELEVDVGGGAESSGAASGSDGDGREREGGEGGVTRSAIGPGSIALGSHDRCAAALAKLHGTSSFGRVSAPCGVTIPDVAGFAA